MIQSVSSDARFPLIVVSLTAQIEQAAAQLSREEAVGLVSDLHWADNPADYPFTWTKKRVETIVLDVSHRWERQTLHVSPPEEYPKEFSLFGREAIFCVSSVGDIDGDGQLEVLSAISLDSNHSYLLVYSLAGQHYMPKQIIEMHDPIAFIRSVSLGDVDDDGCDEIVLGGRPDGNIVLLTPRTGMQTTIEREMYGKGTTNTREVLIEDINNDGQLEILAAVAQQDTAKWGRTPGVLVAYHKETSEWKRCIVDDFEHLTHSRMIGIGKLKSDKNCIVANRVGVLEASRGQIGLPSQMCLYEVSRNGIHKEVIDTLTGAIKSRGFACGDFDGDHCQEIVVGTRCLDLPGQNGTFLYMYKYDTGTQAWFREVIEHSNTCAGYHCVASVDVDADGQDEIVASEDAMGLIKVYKRNAGKWTHFVVAKYPYRLFVSSICGFTPRMQSSRHP